MWVGKVRSSFGFNEVLRMGLRLIAAVSTAQLLLIGHKALPCHFVLMIEKLLLQNLLLNIQANMLAAPS